MLLSAYSDPHKAAHHTNSIGPIYKGWLEFKIVGVYRLTTNPRIIFIDHRSEVIPQGLLFLLIYVLIRIILFGHFWISFDPFSSQSPYSYLNFYIKAQEIQTFGSTHQQFKQLQTNAHKQLTNNKYKTKMKTKN